MTLYTIFNENNKQVFSTFAEGETHFFYRGFNSDEEAKNTTFNWSLNYQIKQLKPNSKGITKPISLLKAEIKMTLNGKWSKIE